MNTTTMLHFRNQPTEVTAGNENGLFLQIEADGSRVVAFLKEEQAEEIILKLTVALGQRGAAAKAGVA